MKSIQIALLLALFLPAAAEVSADSRPSQSSSSKSSSSKSSSFKSGFSSQRAAPTSSNRSSGNSSFGGFGNRPSAPPPDAPAASGRNGGFGSFGNAPREQSSAQPKKSDSALSQSISKSNAEANALRTLEARRAAQEAARAPQPVPVPPAGQYDQRNANNGNNSNNGQYGGQNSGGGYNGGGYNGGSAGQYGNGPAPVVVQQNNGLMNVITGFLLARAVSDNRPRHRDQTSYPNQAGNGNYGSNGNSASNGNNGSVSSDNSSMATAAGANAIPVQSPQKSSWGTAILRTIAWLAILGALIWLGRFVWKFLRRGKAPSTANYTFERN